MRLALAIALTLFACDANGGEFEDLRADLLAEAGWSTVPTAAPETISLNASKSGHYNDPEWVRLDKLQITVAGVDTREVHLHHPKYPNGQWVILHDGHVQWWGVTHCDYTYGALCSPETIFQLLRHGFGVAAIPMPLVMTGSDYTHVFPDSYSATMRRNNHIDYAQYEAHGVPWLPHFVEPAIRTVGHLLGIGATKVHMIGLSGGGWTTAVVAAMDPRVSVSCNVAGTIPHDVGATTNWDWEELPARPLYSVVSMRDIFALGAYPGRVAIQVLNDADSIARLAVPTVAKRLQIVEYEAGVNFRVPDPGRFAAHVVSVTGHRFQPRAWARCLPTMIGEL